MKTNLLSTSKLKSYRTATIVLIITFLIIGTYYAIVLLVKEDYYMLIIYPGLLFFLIRWHIDLKKLKSISYDESSVYYKKDGYEVQIPFEEVKDIEWLGLGNFSINLYRPVQGVKKIWFLASVWYPFNFKKKNDDVDRLCDKIDTYKRSISDENMEELPSYQIQ
jgi:hypothetical protein